MAVAFLFGAKVVLFRANSNTAAGKTVKVRLAVGIGVMFGTSVFGSCVELGGKAKRAMVAHRPPAAYCFITLRTLVSSSACSQRR